MKKLMIVILAMAVLTIGVGTASAWDLCYNDLNYTVTELWITIEGSVIRGQAVIPTCPDCLGFPAPINGTLSGGKAYFAIGYLDNYGERFYTVSASNGLGTTWGIDSATAEYYDPPHSAQVVPCRASLSLSAGGETGAIE